MDNPPELWAFLFANAWLFVSSSVLTVLCYLTYRRSGGRSAYLLATVGFGLVVLGGAVEPVYQFSVRKGTHPGATELLWLQTSEGVLIAAGLGLLFYAITRHDPESSRSDGGQPDRADGSVSWGDPQWDD